MIKPTKTITDKLKKNSDTDFETSTNLAEMAQTANKVNATDYIEKTNRSNKIKKPTNFIGKADVTNTIGEHITTAKTGENADNLLPKDFRGKLAMAKETLHVPRSNQLSKPTCDLILKDTKEKYGLEDTNEALAIISVFAQHGGTASSCDGNMKITFLGKDYLLAGIRQIFTQNKAKNGLRKFCRTYGNKIYAICKELDIPGNMYKKILHLNPAEREVEQLKHWLSDFQAFNPDAPAQARSYIIKAFPNNKGKRKG